MEVHSTLGPGLLESAYRTCLCHELALSGVHYETEVPLPVRYKGIVIQAGYRLDVRVEKTVVVELKAVEKLLPIHSSQLLSYLRLANHRVGLLINFNVRHLRHGIRRLMN